MEDPPAACRHSKDALGRFVVADGLGRLCGLVVRSPFCFLLLLLCLRVLYLFLFAFAFTFAFAVAFAVAFGRMVAKATQASEV